jgi:hypothetical protein
MAFSQMMATEPLDDAAFDIVAGLVADEWGAQFPDSDHAVFIDLVMDARYHRNRIAALEAERERRLARIIHLEAALRRISLIDYPEAALPRDIAAAALEAKEAT